MKQFTFFMVVFFSVNTFGQSLDMSDQIVSETFKEIKAICDKDNGRLWGRNLWGPILIANRNSKMIKTNQQDSAGILTNCGSVYSGTFPDNKIISNSTIELWGTFWTMVAYIPSNEYERNTLILHESFHRLQPELRLDNIGYENNHMDELMARVLLKLEWAALETSVREGESRNLKNLLNALIFRNYRRYLFMGCDSMENKFEIHEGLADYTANKLCSVSEKELQIHLLEKHEEYWNKESLVRSFGYYSGFLYAFLLDSKQINWRDNISISTDLGKILKDSLNITIPEDLKLAFEAVRDEYGYSKIYDSEMIFQADKEALKRKYKDSFFNNPVLKIKLNDPHIGFNVNSIQPLDSLGSVYEFIVITDTWGRLEVSGEGCLLSNNWSFAIIPASQIIENKNIVKGKSWELILNDNWEVIPVDSNYHLKLR